jgi:hypothetical protein
LRRLSGVLPRILATIVLLVSISMLVPLAFAVIHLTRGITVMPMSWLLPLALIGVGAALMSILSRKQVPLELFLAAIALWLVTAGYFWVRIGI